MIKMFDQLLKGDDGRINDIRWGCHLGHKTHERLPVNISHIEAPVFDGGNKGFRKVAARPLGHTSVSPWNDLKVEEVRLGGQHELESGWHADFPTRRTKVS
jgi:hypothetical protein